MDMNVNYTIVGAFVITLFTCIVLGIIWLSSGFTLEEYSPYMVYMQESVTGLSVDAQVELNGVKVGSVKSITIDQANPRIVELMLTIKSDTPITQGTEATLDTKGITGIAFVALKDKGTNLKPLRALPGQPYPVIKTSPSIFLRMDTAFSKLNESLSKVTDSIQSLLDAENLKSIKETLKNLDQITRSLANDSKKFSIIINNTAQASHQFKPAMQVLTTQTLPSTNNVLENVDDITKSLKDNPSLLIRGAAPLPLGPGEK